MMHKENVVVARASIELQGSDIACFPRLAGVEPRFALDAALPKLVDWARRYEEAVADPTKQDDLIAIGREMFAWLDEAGWASAWQAGGGDRILDVIASGDPDEQEAALLDAPWELLANAKGFLADDDRMFVPCRRLGPPGTVWTPQHGDLQILFMAAAVEGQSELDFEQEESGILEATKNVRDVRVIVEESGTLAELGARLSQDEGPFEVVHISCHGTITEETGPVLLLETAEGDADLVGPRDIARAIGAMPPALVFFSACRSAARGKGELAASFAARIAAVVPNVIGWDGSVYDLDATDFACAFYHELGRMRNVPAAAAAARMALLKKRARQEGGTHWHLARAYAGVGGGGPLCVAKGKLRRHVADAEVKAFLDRNRGRVEVAGRHAFVGRRRVLQSVLRRFKEGSAGVLVHGMGALGKSSVAARISSRVQLRTCVIFERYDALEILGEMIDLLPTAAQRTAERSQWTDIVRTDPSALADILKDWLEGPLNADPILLIIDDLERILETPQPGDVLTGVAAEYRLPLAAVLSAFERARTRSRLLLTSRYDFTLPDGRGSDRAVSLARQPLREMTLEERLKQLRTAARLAGTALSRRDAEALSLCEQALELGGGNPGLQAALTKPLLAGELEAGRQALEQVAFYLKEGAPPKDIQAEIDAGSAKDSDNALIAFFGRVSMQTYREALTEDERRQLAASCFFTDGVPIPRAAHVAVGTANGCAQPESALDRLVALGLIEDWLVIGAQQHAAVASLARPLTA